MSKLEDEFRHMLIRNTVPLDVERLYGSIRRVSLSFASNDGDIDESCFEVQVASYKNAMLVSFVPRISKSINI